MAEENSLPATQDGAAPEAPPLAINEAAVPARSLAAEKVTDVLPYAAYERVGQLALSPEAEKVLNDPLPDDEVDIRPDDGMIYASHEFYRRQLNKAFGRMQWTLVPGSPLTQRPDTNEWYQRWVLFVGGIYCAEAFESYDYQPNNARMDLSDVAEAIKSGALKRCCKDLGIASECWNKRFQQRWRGEHAIQVVAKVFRRGQEVNAKVWRRKDADPLPGELQSPQTPPARQPDAQPQTQVAPATPPTAATAPAAAAVQPEKKPVGRPKKVVMKPDAAPASAPAAAPAPVPAPTPQQQPQGRTPLLLDSQVRLLFARGRSAGLILADDASPMIDFLSDFFGRPAILGDGKTSTENCMANFKTVPPNRFVELVKKLDELAKGAQPENGVEKI